MFYFTEHIGNHFIILKTFIIFTSDKTCGFVVRNKMAFMTAKLHCLQSQTCHNSCKCHEILYLFLKRVSLVNRVSCPRHNGARKHIIVNI